MSPQPQCRRFAWKRFRLVWVLALSMLPVFVASCSADDVEDGGDEVSESNALFEDVTSASGIDFTNRGGGIGGMHIPEISGGGVAIFDVEGDGDLDIYFANGGHPPIEGPIDPSQPNRLFLNQGDGKFEDATEGSGLDVADYTFGVSVGDVDNDGDLDAYLTQYGGPDVLLRNDGEGRFEDVTAQAGLGDERWTSGSVFVDYDRDGDLDLFVNGYIQYRTELPCADGLGRKDFCGPQSFDPLPDRLYRNDGTGTFEDVSEETGIADKAGPGLGVAAADFDADGWIDFYVTNDGEPNFLWMNSGEGGFSEEAVNRGAAFNVMGQTEAGMGVVAEDLDQDTWVDLFMTHLRNESNTLYRNLGEDRGFFDVTNRSFLGAPSQRFTGFGLVAVDLHADGDLDLVVANGGVRLGSIEPEFVDESDLGPPLERYVEPNHIYVNDGKGSFESLELEACGLCADFAISRGAAVGDLDSDGDEDVVITNIEEPARVFRNRGPLENWLGVRVVDKGLGREAYGARLVLSTGTRSLLRTVTSSKGYLSSSDSRVFFGLGDETSAGTIAVQWPSGSLDIEVFTPECLNCEIVLVRGEGEVQ